MTASRHQRLSDLVSAARGLPPDQVSTLLDRECGGDDALRAEVESLVMAAHDVGSFLNAPALGTGVAEQLANADPDAGGAGHSGSLAPGYRLGSMQIVRSLGCGGMGEVYLALQDDPRRRVALKVIRTGLDTDETIVRFRLEQRALAAMAHPHIAQIYEVGTTPPAAGGRLYFTMEYVEGEPITQYCDRRNMAIRSRLELFRAVCEAVQHAHNRGIVHRDLKPSNVLVAEVEGRPVPKVIDFGVAKEVDSTQNARTVYSAGRSFIGTPEYMSPEQASASADVDLRTDVYSLGVMLYELLAGSVPFPPSRLLARGLDDACRIIRDETPPRPSSLIATFEEGPQRVAASRSHDANSLRRELRRELEWIPLAAMRKERDRRYQTPRALADDLRRYLDGRALWAAPESRVYTARKFLRRHKTGAAMGVAIVGVLAVATWALGRVSVERAQRLLTQEQREHEHDIDSIRGAQFALDAHDVATAREQLERVPIGRRGWEWNYFREALSDSLAELPARAQPAVHAIAISPDGVTAAIGLGTGAVLLWDWRQGGAPRSCAHHDAAVTRVAFSPDGGRLLSASADGVVQLQRLAQGATTQTFALGRALDNAVFSGDGKRVVATGVDGSALVFDAADGRLLSENAAEQVGAPGDRHTSVSSGGALAVTVSADSVAKVWRPVDGTTLWTLPGRGRPGRVALAIVSPDGRWVAHAWDGRILLSSATSEGAGVNLEGHTNEITSLAFSADSARLVSTSLDRTARIWTLGNPHALHVLRGHDEAVAKALFTPDGKHVVTTGHDATVRLWSARTGELLATLHGHSARLVNLALSADGALALSSSEDNAVLVWDIAAAAARATLSKQPGNVAAANFSPDGSRLVVVTNGIPDSSSSVAVWGRDGHKVIDLRGYTPDVWSATYNPSGDRLVTASSDGTARVWDGATGEPTDPPVVLRHERCLHFAAYSPDGRRIITASEDGTACVWNAANGEMLTRLRHEHAVRCAVFLPDGARVATACDDGDVRIWDAASGRMSQQLAGDGNALISVSVDADGGRLASSSANGTVRVWDLSTGRAAGVLSGHTRSVLSVQFSPDGARLATASWDNSVRVWDSESLREIVAFRDRHGGANRAAFSPDGADLLSCYQDGTLVVRRGRPPPEGPARDAAHKER